MGKQCYIHFLSAVASLILAVPVVFPIRAMLDRNCTDLISARSEIAEGQQFASVKTILDKYKIRHEITTTSSGHNQRIDIVAFITFRAPDRLVLEFGDNRIEQIQFFNSDHVISETMLKRPYVFGTASLIADLVLTALLIFAMLGIVLTVTRRHDPASRVRDFAISCCSIVVFLVLYFVSPVCNYLLTQAFETLR